MKNARTTDSNASALYKREYTTQTFRPPRPDTILAGVLAWLVAGGSPLTAWDGVEAFRTLHLDAAIRTLKRKYRMPIETVALPTRRADGSIFYVTGYKLSQVVVDHAHSSSNWQSWIRIVKLAQARKRARDNAKAAALDFYRLSTGHPSFLSIQQYLYRR
jgi:hypothetical protein